MLGTQFGFVGTRFL